MMTSSLCNNTETKTVDLRYFKLLDTLLKYPYLEDNLAQNNAMAQQLNASQ